MRQRLKELRRRVSEFFRRRAAMGICAVLGNRYGAKAADAYLWNCTPFPMGLPSWSQLWDGVLLALGRCTMNDFERRDMAQWRTLQPARS